jgi:hypothetical protein
MNPDDNAAKRPPPRFADRTAAITDGAAAVAAQQQRSEADEIGDIGDIGPLQRCRGDQAGSAGLTDAPD